MHLKIIHYLIYILFRGFGEAVASLPHPLLYRLGKFGGTILFYLHHEFRKKSMTNLALAYPNLKEESRRVIAIQSFQNLLITCLEFFWLKRNKKRLHELVTIEGGKETEERLQRKEGVIFMSAHQANWEIPFLIVSSHGSGIGIGRPVKNKWIYRYVLSMREMNGGKIILPKNAIKEGLRALKKGQFVGVVGDQAFPESSYSYPLFGTRAWTTTMPALLAYRTGSPIVVATTVRVGRKYRLIPSLPLFPNLNTPAKDEVVRLMDLSMSHLEKSILEHPGDWLWQHDRWKQQGSGHVKRKYRFSFIAILLSKDNSHQNLLPLLRKIYPNSFFSIFVSNRTTLDFPDIEVHYLDEKESYPRDYRYQLVLDFTDNRGARKHFLSLGAIEALSLKKMEKISGKKDPSEALLHTLCKKGSISKLIS